MLEEQLGTTLPHLGGGALLTVSQYPRWLLPQRHSRGLSRPGLWRADWRLASGTNTLAYSKAITVWKDFSDHQKPIDTGKSLPLVANQETAWLNPF